MTPVLWGRASSVNVQKVMWALAECAVPHERIDAGGKYGRTDEEAFGEMNPLRRVPVWQEDGLALWESHAILRHLARGPCARLWPSDRADQARADQWIEFTTTTLLPPFIGVFFQKVRLPEAQRSAQALEGHLGRLEDAVAVLDGALSGRSWLAGDNLTLADIAAGTAMYRYHVMDISRPDRPALAAWYGRLTTRAPYQETVMTSYEELRRA